MKHIIHILQIILCAVGCVLYPFWIIDGFLTDTYPMVGAFIACYGGFIGGVLWYAQNFRNL